MTAAESAAADADADGDATGEEPSLWQNRGFRRFFAGQFVTNAGDSLYSVAVLWLVFELSGSTALTGVASSMLLLPWLLQALAGPLVDRLPLRPVLVGSQALQGVVVLAVPLAAATGNLSVGVLFAVIPALTLATLLMAPMQATLVPRIVADGRLSKANAALATVTLGLDMLFDAAGGAFVAVFDATTLFLVDAATFAVAGLLFAGITVPPATGDDAGGDAGGGGDAGADRNVGADSDAGADDPESGSGARSAPDRGTGAGSGSGSGAVTGSTHGPGSALGAALGSYVADLRAGVAALRGTVFVELVGLTAVANLATGVTLAVLPAYGAGLGGPAVYGLLLGALGTGRLVGSLVAPSLEGVGYGRFLLVGQSLGACAWVGAVLVPSPALTVVLFGLAWVPAGASGVLTSTLNQTVFPADRLARVTSIKGTASGATLPLGSLVGGAVAELLGTTTTVGLAAFGFGVTGLYVLARPRLRGLPAVAEADPAAFGVTVDSGDADGE